MKVVFQLNLMQLHSHYILCIYKFYHTQISLYFRHLYQIKNLELLHLVILLFQFLNILKFFLYIRLLNFQVIFLLFYRKQIIFIFIFYSYNVIISSTSSLFATDNEKGILQEEELSSFNIV